MAEHQLSLLIHEALILFFASIAVEFLAKHLKLAQMAGFASAHGRSGSCASALLSRRFVGGPTGMTGAVEESNAIGCFHVGKTVIPVPRVGIFVLALPFGGRAASRFFGGCQLGRLEVLGVGLGVMMIVVVVVELGWLGG